MKARGSRHRCGNCRTVDKCKIYWLEEEGHDGLVPYWLCSQCREIMDTEWPEPDSEPVVCSNCGSTVYPDGDDTCPECGANVYSLGW